MPQINGFCIFDGWKFDAELKVDKNNEPGSKDAQHDAQRVYDGFFIVTGRGMRSRGPARVYPFCVKMHGTVTTHPNKNNQKWELGFIQSILASTRIAKYGPGNEAIKRQNPTNCPVIDRDGSTNYFYETPTPLKMCGKTEVEMTDEPNHDFELMRKRHMLTEAIEDTTFLTLLAASTKRPESSSRSGAIVGTPIGEQRTSMAFSRFKNITRTFCAKSTDKFNDTGLRTFGSEMAV